MARRKELKIKLTELERYKDVLELIKDDPKFEGFDISTIELKALGNITPVIKDPQRAISRLEYYLSATYGITSNMQSNKGDAYIKPMTKTQLSKVLGITRVTLDKWLSAGFIATSYVGYGDFPDNVEFFEVLAPDIVLSHLKDYKEQNLK